VKWHEIKRQRLKPNKDMIEAQQRPHFQELQQLSADLLNTAQRTHGIVQKLIHHDPSSTTYHGMLFGWMALVDCQSAPRFPDSDAEARSWGGGGGVQITPSAQKGQQQQKPGHFFLDP
jgi:hypothetical protein